MKDINVVLFDDFTIIDAFGPIEVFSRLQKYYQIGYYSLNGGIVRTNPSFELKTKSFDEIESFDILLIPGGFGTRKLVEDGNFISKLKKISEKSNEVLTVCTGSGLLAKTGVLKNKNATSNKLAFDWVIEQDREVKWIKKARWVADGKYYSSSGVAAGIDMALGYVRDKFGIEVAEKIANGLEYIWNRNSEDDAFSI